MSSEGMRRYWQEVRHIAEDRGISMTNARGVWRTLKARGDLPEVGPDEDLEIQVQAILEGSGEDTGLVCPYCRDSVYEEDEIRSCSECRTCIHRECADELRNRCITLGCRGWFASDASVVNSRIRVRPEPIRLEGREIPFLTGLFERAMSGRVSDIVHDSLVAIAFLLIAYCIYNLLLLP